LTILKHTPSISPEGAVRVQSGPPLAGAGSWSSTVPLRHQGTVTMTTNCDALHNTSSVGKVVRSAAAVNDVQKHLDKDKAVVVDGADAPHICSLRFVQLHNGFFVFNNWHV